MKISAVYKITNTITGDFYIGSSKNIKYRWKQHKRPSVWKDHSNISLYQDMQKYGVDKFDFQILVQVRQEQLKEAEQQFIEKLCPAYNARRADGLDVERRKKYQKQYQKKYYKKYQQSTKGKDSNKKASNKYNNQLCFYNGEILKLCALSSRFRRAGIEHPTLEAKKYLLLK